MASKAKSDVPSAPSTLSVSAAGPLTILALQRADMPVDIATGKEQPRPGPGTYSAESVRLLLSYSLRIGQPFRQTVAASIPWQRIALLALGKMNETTAAAIVNEALADTPLPEEPAERIRAEVDRLRAPAVREVQGRVTGHVVVAEVRGGT